MGIYTETQLMECVSREIDEMLQIMKDANAGNLSPQDIAARAAIYAETERRERMLFEWYMGIRIKGKEAG